MYQRCDACAGKLHADNAESDREGERDEKDNKIQFYDSCDSETTYRRERMSEIRLHCTKQPMQE